MLQFAGGGGEEVLGKPPRSPDNINVSYINIKYISMVVAFVIVVVVVVFVITRRFQ